VSAGNVERVRPAPGGVWRRGELGSAMHMLSQRERRLLESIESSIEAEDPAFAARLSGQRAWRARLAGRPAWRARLPGRHAWRQRLAGRHAWRARLAGRAPSIGCLALLAGAVVTIGWFTTSLWLASAGVAAMIAGALLVADPLARRVARVRSRRAR
jgi:hypothetical protein